jgi:two-component SAPR family response regulator
MIIVIDDDYDIASLIKIGLEKAGLSASAFTEPLTALEDFRSHPLDYDLVISDIRMPVMNGYELAQQIKKIKSDVKILFMSAFEYDDLYFDNDQSHLDIVGFLEKPIPLSKLQTVVFTILNTNINNSIPILL